MVFGTQMVVGRHHCGIPSVCTHHTHSKGGYNRTRESRTCAKAAMPGGIRVHGSPSTATLIDWSFIFLTGWRPAISQVTERGWGVVKGRKQEKRKEKEEEEKKGKMKSMRAKKKDKDR